MHDDDAKHLHELLKRSCDRLGSRYTYTGMGGAPTFVYRDAEIVIFYDGDCRFTVAPRHGRISVVDLGNEMPEAERHFESVEAICAWPELAIDDAMTDWRQALAA